jgi:hypothetical protein
MVGGKKCDLQRQHRNLLKYMTSLFSVVNFIVYLPFIGCISCIIHVIIWAKVKFHFFSPYYLGKMDGVKGYHNTSAVIIEKYE